MSTCGFGEDHDSTYKSVFIHLVVLLCFPHLLLSYPSRYSFPSSWFPSILCFCVSMLTLVGSRKLGL